ncbi:MAG: sulfatase-like hydrolase/transferase [Candidatus Sumerlaeota bacterium]|nr:sulfatase-like hydrolase/transferase [Candidatus Sumerlaeota bacterium]
MSQFKPPARSRRSFMRSIAAAGGAAIALPGILRAQTQDRPNILWISCEDTSPVLGCYGDPQGRTPNLDRLAADGARYTRAFTVAGVCAPSRSGIITGKYPSSIGTCPMRCKISPQPARCFPEYLREAGYYCSNNSKTDYNFAAPKAAWDESSSKAHWRNRAPGQPFFSVFNITTTHEVQIRRPFTGDIGERHDPAKASPPPYYPDTPTTRQQWAQFYDCVTKMDGQAAQILKQLDEDGLAQNTAVFFWGDHGVGLARSKRWVYDSGTHIPLLVRWPGGIPPGTVVEDLVSGVDFGPTVLSLAGVPIPQDMQGQAFLGAQKAAAPRQYVYAARDRIDERNDIIRGLRDKRFRYIRNFEPYKPYAQWVSYAEASPLMKEMRQLNAEGKLTGPPALFFRPTKPVEELFDTDQDPHEIHSQAEAPEQRQTLERMRKELERWMLEIGDRGLVPESLASGPVPDMKTDPNDVPLPLLGKSAGELSPLLKDPRRPVRLLAIKALAARGEEARAGLLDCLAHDDPAMRFWAAVHLGVFGADDKPIAQTKLRAALQDESAAVRVAAALALCQLGHGDDSPAVFSKALKDGNDYMHLLAADAIDRLGPPAIEACRPALQEALKDKLGYVRDIAQHALGVSAASKPAKRAKERRQPSSAGD